MVYEHRAPRSDEALVQALQALDRFQARPSYPASSKRATALGIAVRYHLMKEHHPLIRDLVHTWAAFHVWHLSLLDAFEEDALKAIRKSDNAEQAALRVRTRHDDAEEKFESIRQNANAKARKAIEDYEENLRRAYASRWDMTKPTAAWKRPFAWLAHNLLARHVDDKIVKPYVATALEESVSRNRETWDAEIQARDHEISRRLDEAIEKARQREQNSRKRT